MRSAADFFSSKFATGPVAGDIDLCSPNTWIANSMDVIDLTRAVDATLPNIRMTLQRNFS
jgi:hypothetical protein